MEYMEVKRRGRLFGCQGRLNNEHLALLPQSLIKIEACCLLPKTIFCSVLIGLPHGLPEDSLQSSCLLRVLDCCEKIGQRPVAEDLHGLGPRERRHVGILFTSSCVRGPGLKGLQVLLDELFHPLAREGS